MSRYQEAGVDIHAGYELVNKIKKDVKSTQRMGTTGNIGSFGGTFDLSVLNVKEPVLVSGTDGVGTKLLIAQKMDKHDTIGIDCVAMCVNDILAQGAEPLYFLDYIATGKNDPDKIAQIVAGVAEGCRQAGTALIGGETAEMPGFYKEGDYDIAGFCVGIVEKENLIDGSKVKEGNKIIAVASSGFHSNGYSLVRKVFTDYNEKISLKEYGENVTMGDVLLTPTKIYVKPILKVLEKFNVNGMAHITGGGLFENLPRCMGKDLSPVVFREKVRVPEIFKLIAERSKIKEEELFGTFNMGVGFTLVVEEKDVEPIIELLTSLGETAYEIGHIEKGDHSLCLK